MIPLALLLATKTIEKTVQPYDFRGVKLGESLSVVKAAIPSLNCSTQFEMTSCRQGKVEIDYNGVSAEYSFLLGQAANLFCIAYR